MIIKNYTEKGVKYSSDQSKVMNVKMNVVYGAFTLNGGNSSSSTRNQESIEFDNIISVEMDNIHCSIMDISGKLKILSANNIFNLEIEESKYTIEQRKKYDQEKKDRENTTAHKVGELIGNLLS